MAAGNPVFYIGKNNTSPVITAQLFNSSGDAVALGGASVVFHFHDLGGALRFSRAATIVSTGGIVSYPWQAGDTATSGTYLGRFQVTFATALVQDYPNDRYIEIVVS